MSEVVKLERHDDIAIVTVDSPPVNALSAAVRGGIQECIRNAISDPHVKAIVLTCAGRTFIAGADITEFGKPPKPPGLNEVLVEMENSPKPIVAAIHGTALGGGLEVALACHFRVAVKEAKLGLPEVKVGILPGGGGTQKLARVVGLKRAMLLIMTGRMFSAAEALSMGVISEVAPTGQALSRAIEVAREIAGKSPDAVRAAKRLLNMLSVDPGPALLAESIEQQKLIGSPNQTEAVRANIDKRAPRFADAG